MIETLMNNIDVHAIRDPTSGCVSSTLNEIAQSVRLKIELDETRLPIKKSVASACDILGLDPLMIANEGTMLIFIKDSDKEEALSILKNFEEGINSTIIGKVCGYDKKGLVLINTYLGTKRVLEMINGEQLPRIC